MADNKKHKGSTVIRIIICVIILIVLFLGVFGILPRKVTVPVSNLLLMVVSLWNGIEYAREGRKKEAVLIFFTAAILALTLVINFISL